jgi:hypothetical protein
VCECVCVCVCVCVCERTVTDVCVSVCELCAVRGVRVCGDTIGGEGEG